MRRTGRHRGRAAPPTDGAPQKRRRALLATLLVAGLAAGTAIVAGSDQAVWVCVPGALFVSARPTGRVGAAASVVVVLAATCGASVAEHPASTEPLVAL